MREEKTPLFLLLCGYGGKDRRHWQTFLADHLRKKGAEVLYPDMPSPNWPRREAWLKMLEEVLKGKKDRPLVVAGHSLGCILWLHYIKKHPNVRVEKGFLVAPPANDCGVPAIADFFPLPDLNLDGKNYVLIGSDNDLFIPLKDFEGLARSLNISLKLIPGAGHINAPEHGDWKWMNEKCLNLIGE